ncbi:MAG: response regulator transcription factor [Bryobacteraceae bacterium]|jgi:DNA-binding NarL/FixJ family response regulator
MDREIGIVIAEDHPIFRAGLRRFIEAEPDMKVVGEAGDGERALDLIRSTRPRVAVLDVDMPRKDGLEVAREVQSLRLDVTLIFLTLHQNERFFNAALDLGVKGYVLKDCASTEIVDGIRAVAAGRGYVTPVLTDFLLNRRRAMARGEEGTPLASLTPAERTVLRLVAEYKTSKQIADDLFISVRTVDRHRANIAAKLDLAGSHALLQFAIEHKAAL